MSSERPEFSFINRLRAQVRNRPPVDVGIGDDAAVLAATGTQPTVVTTDMLMEGVDFRWPEASAERIGRKALAVNLSDIAAMGCRPTAVFASVAFPKSRGTTFADEVFNGLLKLAEDFDVTLAGGDTNTWDGPLVLSLTVLGTPVSSAPWLRSGAQPGDILVVTGPLGGSIHGRHLDFMPRLKEAAWLANIITVHAAIDISDGLAADLHHLLKASQVGAELDASAIPIHDDVALSTDDQPPLSHALADGEDFELLLAIAPGDLQPVQSAWPFATPLTPLGTCTVDQAVWLTDGASCQRLLPTGWNHTWDD